MLEKILQRYGKLPFFDRFHIKTRYRRANFEWLGDFVPKKGKILDFGCGHGVFSLFLTLSSPDRELCGVDIDERKIEMAKKATEGLSVKFFSAGDFSMPKELFDAVLLIDVIYLLPEEAQFDIVKKAFGALKKRGVMLIKMNDPDAPDKLLGYLQEFVMKFILGRTKGDKVCFLRPEKVAGFLEKNGSKCEVLKVPNSPRSSKLIICRKK